MAFKLITKYNSPNFTAGRNGNKPTHITIHWWDDPKKAPSFQGVINSLCNSARQVSAHYVATGTGRQVACLVDCWNTAWADGNWASNLTSISIECDPRCRDEDYDVIAELIVEIWKSYGKLPLKRHQDVSDSYTACPGNYDLTRLKNEAEAKYSGGTAKTKKVKAAPPKPQAKNIKKWPKPRRFKTNKQPTNLWDLKSNPNWKSVKKYEKNTLIEVAGEIAYNGSVYYLTEYSISKKIMNGFNKVDLNEVEKEKKTATKTETVEKVAEKPKTETVEKVAEKPKTETVEKSAEKEKTAASKKSAASEEDELKKMAVEVAKNGEKLAANNSLLQKIHDLILWLVGKIKAIFK